jgi:hypothetical protein
MNPDESEMDVEGRGGSLGQRQTRVVWSIECRVCLPVNAPLIVDTIFEIEQLS